MIDMLLWGYLAGVIVATLICYVASKRLTDRRSPSAHPLVLSVLAGLLWPLMLVGLVELSSVMLCVKAHARHDSELGIYA